MSDNERKKKEGRNKDKKNKAERDAVKERARDAHAPRSSAPQPQRAARGGKISDGRERGVVGNTTQAIGERAFPPARCAAAWSAGRRHEKNRIGVFSVSQ
jgi:hypothetical protein